MPIATPLQKVLAKRFAMLPPTTPCYTTRQEAWHALMQQGLPTVKNEAYKYTPIAAILTEKFAFSQSNVTPTLSQTVCTSLLKDTIDGYPIVFLNGRLHSVHPALTAHQAALQLCSFQEAAQQNLFLQHFAKLAQGHTESLAALNTAIFEEGYFIQLADYAIIEKPLVLHYITVTNKTPILSCPRLLVVAGQHSQVSIATSWHTIGAPPSFTNAVTELFLAKAAQVHYYTLQTAPGHQAYQVNTTQCYQAQQSVLNTYTFTCEGTVVRNNVTTCMDAAHSEANLYGLYCLNGQQHTDNYTQVDHRKPHACSNEHYKGILADAATGVFNGRIYVQPEAQKTNAFQLNNNIVLSAQAKHYTKPQLEIWADDVKCSHGATIGQLDETQLFYLNTRGIPAATAQHLLLGAFAHEIIDKVPLQAVKNKLYRTFETKLYKLIKG